MLRASKTMESGEVVRWCRSPGDAVTKGDVLLEIETEKATVELESPDGGVLLAVMVNEGAVVPVGAVLGWIGQAGEKIPADPPTEATTLSVRASAPPAQADRQSLSAPMAVGATQRPKASPAVRRMATAIGVPLSTVRGTGLDGRITSEDVGAAAAADGTASEGELHDERSPLRGFRRVMSERLAGVTPAAVTTVMEADMGAALGLKDRLSIMFTTPVAAAVARALIRHRLLNASLEGDQVVFHRHVELGVAAETPRGLTVVTVRGADKLGINELDRELRGLIGSAKDGHTVPVTAPPTFTVTNSGGLGSLMFTPVITPPQSATLGLGEVRDTPVVRDGEIVVRPIMRLCLTYDHRFIEGAEAVRFLADVKSALEESSVLDADPSGPGPGGVES
jgi:pyruvate/2-oxoglutarate dehydrogenase complex dihydrolipoamide acyltransferase (E2) component